MLVELGFISNSTDLGVLKKAEERDKIATRLCNAFKEYKAIYDGSLVLDVENEDSSSVPDTPAAKAPTVRYGIQIFAGSKKLDSRDKAFMGYTPFIQNTGKIYKYVIAVGENLQEVKGHLGEIRKKYPDAFVVKIEDGKASLLK